MTPDLFEEEQVNDGKMKFTELVQLMKHTNARNIESFILFPLQNVE